MDFITFCILLLTISYQLLRSHGTTVAVFSSQPMPVVADTEIPAARLD